MNAKYFLYSLCCGLAFSLGMLTEASPGRDLAQDTPARSFLSYEQIPCPSSDEMSGYITAAHMVGMPDMPTCDGSPSEKILKLFKLASLLKVDLPKKWAAHAEKPLNDILKFISTSTPRLNMSTAASHAIASNNNRQEIFLSGEFFRLPPLKALEILIHENQHSFQEAEGHVHCLTGDVLKSAGACDALFSSGPSMGAYSMGVWFSLAYSLYGKNLNPQSRQQLMNSAIAILSTRFNNVPYTLAVPLDLLYVLTESGQVALVHPYTLEHFPIDIQTEKNDKIERIQFNPLQNGLLAFTQRGRIHAIDHWGKQTDYYAHILPSAHHYVDSNKVLTPSAQYAHTYFVEESGDIFFKDIHIANEEDRLYTFRHNLPFITRRFFTALGSTMVALSENGSFYNLSSGYGPAALKPAILKSTEIPNLQWKDGSGGVTYDVLYAVGSDGRVYFSDDSPLLQEPIQPSSFISDQPFEKFQESLNLQAARTTLGHIYLWDHSHSTLKPWRLKTSPVVDFAIGRRYAPSTSLHSLQQSLRDKNICNLKSAYLDPWTQKLMGIDMQGQLVFTGAHPERPCVVYKENTSGDHVELATKVLTRTNTYFDRTFLNFISNGSSIPLFPYTEEEGAP